MSFPSCDICVISFAAPNHSFAIHRVSLCYFPVFVKQNFWRILFYFPFLHRSHIGGARDRFLFPTFFLHIFHVLFSCAIEVAIQHSCVAQNLQSKLDQRTNRISTRIMALHTKMLDAHWLCMRVRYFLVFSLQMQFENFLTKLSALLSILLIAGNSGIAHQISFITIYSYFRALCLRVLPFIRLFVASPFCCKVLSTKFLFNLQGINSLRFDF